MANDVVHAACAAADVKPRRMPVVMRALAGRGIDVVPADESRVAAARRSSTKERVEQAVPEPTPTAPRGRKKSTGDTAANGTAPRTRKAAAEAEPSEPAAKAPATEAPASGEKPARARRGKADDAAAPPAADAAAPPAADAERSEERRGG